MRKGSIGIGFELLGGVLMAFIPGHSTVAWIVLGIGATLILWGFLPNKKIGLVYLAPACFISIFIGVYISSFLNSHQRLTPKKKLKSVYNKNFKNETVQLDGKRYVDCSFENVTFVWEGDRFELGAKGGVKGQVGISSGNTTIKTAGLLFKKLFNLEKLSIERKEKNVDW